ncbi:bacillithiol system redox-active protein YtxJ [Salinimicrobium soli]|uniref:bacillithiol system redox-active protein YtxJ n=1 Tax=Salinimicrobium soli TaxID=1254399 RepID=UPI003AAA695A
MGLFDKMFQSQRDISKKEIEEVPWTPLTNMEQLETIKKESQEQPVLIFKHSTRCGISRMVLKGFENEYEVLKDTDHKMYFLDLIANRDVSNAVASRLSVQHESPQLIVLQDGNVVHHASHHSIQAERVKEFL